MKIPHYSKIHNRFKIYGYHYNQQDLTQVAYSFIKEGAAYEEVIGAFLLDWLDTSPTINVNTSGSTGIPKTIQVSKQAMVHSAVRTGEYFGLEVGDRALHCLPVDYIAGKMMLVRAMILGLDMHMLEPRLELNSFDGNYDFCAMIPLQAKNTLPKIGQIKTLLIGGAPISSSLRTALAAAATDAYETYGMTETLTHIAVSKIVVPQQPFEVLPEIRIATDADDCLQIEAPHLSQTPIQTEDIVSLVDSQRFILIGRKNNVINSGGKKLFPESLEQELGDIHMPFFFAAQPDSELGEKLILLVASETETPATIRKKLSPVLESESFRFLKEIYTLPSFVYTPTGKIDRPSTLKLL